MATRYELSIRQRSQLIAVRDQQLPARGLYVPTTSPPRLFTQISVTVSLPDGVAMQITGQVVNAVPTGFYLLIDGSEQIQFLGDAVKTALEMQPEDSMVILPDEESAPEVAASATTAAPKRRPVRDLINLGSDVPLARQIGDLEVEDRLRLAPLANRSMRRILARDPDKRVHIEVVKNPRLTDDEALEFAGIGGLSPVALKWLAEQERFADRSDILMAIATNPCTQPDTSRRVLDALAHNELYLILRSPRCREATKREARRRLVKAGAL